MMVTTAGTRPALCLLTTYERDDLMQERDAAMQEHELVLHGTVLRLAQITAYQATVLPDPVTLVFLYEGQTLRFRGDDAERVGAWLAEVTGRAPRRVYDA